MSGGRIEFGLGAGWNDVEHAQLGLPFPEIAERGDMLEENLEVLLRPVGRARRLVVRGQARPDPGRPVLPEAGRRARPARRCRTARRDRGSSSAAEGPPRSMRIAARYADEFNLSSSSPDVARTKYGAARRGVRGGRPRPGDDDPLGDVGGADRARPRTSCGARQQRAAAATSATSTRARTGSHERRDRWVFGTPDEARARSSATPRRERSGSCSRTSCRATWRWST